MTQKTKSTARAVSAKRSKGKKTFEVTLNRAQAARIEKMAEMLRVSPGDLMKITTLCSFDGGLDEGDFLKAWAWESLFYSDHAHRDDGREPIESLLEGILPKAKHVA